MGLCMTKLQALRLKRNPKRVEVTIFASNIMKFVCYCSSNFNFVFLKITLKAYRYFWELSDDMLGELHTQAVQMDKME